jgi:hypothetical protein
MCLPSGFYTGLAAGILSMVQGEIPEGCGLLFASGVLKWPSCCGYAAACGRAHRHRLLRIKII